MKIIFKWLKSLFQKRNCKLNYDKEGKIFNCNDGALRKYNGYYDETGWHSNG